MMERIIPEEFGSKEKYLIYLKHLYAYEFVKNKISKNGLVLEVGCGEGYGTNLLSKKVRKIIGLDVDKKTILHASKKYESKSCVFKLYDGLKIPYGDDTFDVIISFQVIEHVQDDRNFISEIFRVLKKNGNLILTTPNRTYRLKKGQKPLNKFHIREYYLHELGNVLKSKFSDVKIWGIRGNEEVQRIEIERVKLDLIKTSFPLNLRKLIPQSLRSMILDTLKRINCRYPKNKKNEDFLNKYNLKDFYVIKNNVKNSLDLLAVCKK